MGVNKMCSPVSRLTEDEQLLLDAAAELISTLRNVDDTRREFECGVTERSTYEAVESGLVSTLADFKSLL